jgi:CDP-diacylglycerol---serine O-phosphatidyltransferase
MARRRRIPRITGLSLNRLIPNVLTLLALCAGLTAIRYAIQGQFQHAVVAIALAAILDGLDGRVARLLQGATKFGAELDSLSDFVCFGVAPALILYHWVMWSAGGIGWAVVMLFTVCCGLRLARFNTMMGQDDLPPYAYNFFTGVPAPAAAGLVLMPLIMSFEVGSGFVDRPFFISIFLIGVSFLMVSKFPTFSAKKLRIPNAYVLPMLLVVGLLAAFLVTEPWLTLTVIDAVYLGMIPLAFKAFKRLKQEAELQSPEASAPPQSPSPPPEVA